MADVPLDLPPDWRDRLAALRAEPKFAATEGYTGYQPDDHRPAAEALLNGLIDRLLADLGANRNRAWLRAQVKDTHDWFRVSDTEDRERCAGYLADVLEALGFSVPDYLAINEWVGIFEIDAAFSHPQLEG